MPPMLETASSESTSSTNHVALMRGVLIIHLTTDLAEDPYLYG